jgi:aminoglycoside phosphotransferase (APT) family kinase protein
MDEGGRGELAAQLAALLGGEVSGLRRLSGGASRETWSFDCGDRPLILQRQRRGATATMPLEVEVLRAASAAGVPVPTVVADATDGAALGSPAVVVERLGGESIARKLLRDEEFAAVRPKVAGECGAILAAIHRIPLDTVEGLVATDPLDGVRTTLADLGEPHPAFELAVRWLDRHRPASGPTTVVHGDFRTGNLLIDPSRVVAVLDWELVHLGDPMEDLGWFCARAWRFGVDDEPAGGFGSREELWSAYEASGGGPVDPDAARWWELLASLRWGVICILQASSHWLGITPSMELAAIGRRASENEHDVLALLAPERTAPAPTPVDPTAGAISVSDRPTAAELAAAIQHWLGTDVLSGTEGRLRFHARVAANAVAMLEREARLGTAHLAALQDRHEALGVADEVALASAIREGTFDDRWDEVVEVVWATVVDKLEVSHPGYAAGRP